MLILHYQTDLGKLYRGDCREIVSDITADTIITDPVWPNCTTKLKGSDDPQGLLSYCLNNSNPTVDRLSIHLGCGSDPRFLAAVNRKRWEFFRVVYFRYIRPSYLGRLLMNADICYLFGPPPKSIKGQHLIPGYYEDTSSDGKQADEHPCPRKLSHVKWQVRWWSQQTDLILDPFMGSGTTAVACEYFQRHWVGIEIDGKFCDIAAARIEKEREQMKLWPIPEYEPQEINNRQGNQAASCHRTSEQTDLNGA